MESVQINNTLVNRNKSCFASAAKSLRKYFEFSSAKITKLNFTVPAPPLCCCTSAIGTTRNLLLLREAH